MNATFSTLAGHFHSVFERMGDALALRFLTDGEQDTMEMSGRDIDRRARALAVRLGERIPVGARALIVCPPGLDYLTAMYGCFFSGVVAVPVYPPDGAAAPRLLGRLLALVEDSTPSVILAPASLAAAGQALPQLAGLDWLAVDEVDLDEGDQWSHPGVTGADLAFLQYTSGSTGRPKGVMVSNANLLANLAAIDHHVIGHRDQDSHSVTWLPPYHDMGLIGGLFEPAYRGYAVTFMSPTDFLKKPIRWLQAISRYRGTVSGGPNFAFDLCVDKIPAEARAGLDLSSWEVAFCGAEPVRAHTIDRFVEAFAPYGLRREALYPCYGMAEATLLVAGGQRSAPPVVLDVRPDSLEVGTIEPALPGEPARSLVGSGQVIDNHRLVVVDPQTRMPLPSRQVGEIWIAGASVASGLWGLPEESHSRLAATLADGSGPYLRSGDLGFLDEGDLFVTGRSSDLIILAGRNHYPTDIEHTVQQVDPALHQGDVVAFSIDPDEVSRGASGSAPIDSEALVVVQGVRASGDFDAAAVGSRIRAAITADHGVAAHEVVFVEAGTVPKTSSGKVQRKATKMAYLKGTLSRLAEKAAPTPARTPTDPTPSVVDGVDRPELERRILTHVAARAGGVRIDPTRPFTDYGMSSVDLVAMLGDLESFVGRALPVTLVWEYPSVQALAAALAAEALTDSEVPGREESSGTAARAVGGVLPNNNDEQDIAIVGIGCRFPGAEGPEAFWQALLEGRDAVTQVPAHRWSAESFFDPDPTAPGKMTTRWGGFISGVDQFDPTFFGIAPREAARMDPQQRLLTEVCWEAFEDAGIVPGQIAGTDTGVFVGIATNDYGHLQFRRLDTVDAFSGTGNALSIAANRLSYLFDLHGPSLAIDTACSSSLVAVHQACESLRRGDCTLAVAGGVNVVLSPALAINFSKAGAMAADGRCKTFDARADGYVRGEGAGIVVLKPLSQAQRDADRVYAVIPGGAINQDGRTNGLMAPNPKAQERVLRTAYTRAGIAPETVGYVELHGTGTLLGDPIEAKALSAVTMPGRPPAQPCLVGSVKSNIGHLEAAAGVAGLVKVALALHHRHLPPSLHFSEPNPHIPLDNLALRVVEEGMPWPQTPEPRVAGVSSFGFGGTNAHVVLTESPSKPGVSAGCSAPGHQDEQAGHSQENVLVLPVSAASEPALHQLAARHAHAVTSGSENDDSAQHQIEAYCRAAALRRTHHQHRMACVGQSRSELIEALHAFIDDDPHPGLVTGRCLEGRTPRAVFVFSGQGPRWWPLDPSLFDGAPAFHETLLRCDAALRRDVSWSLIEQLTMPAEESLLDDPGVAQPATCALQLALAAQWRAWGVEPHAVVGHSLGEVAAAAVSGALDLDTALKVARHRGEVIRAAIGLGNMAVVAATYEQVEALLADETEVSIGASNSPGTTVISGRTAEIERLAARLDAEGVFCRLLESVEYASHSPQMEPLQGQLRARLDGITPRDCELTWVSTVSADVRAGGDADEDYWATNLRSPVLFARAVDRLLDLGFDTFVEISGHPMLGGPLAELLDARNTQGLVTSSLDRNESGARALLRELAWLYAGGFPVDWERVYPEVTPMVNLPRNPWQHERYWLESATPDATPGTAPGDATAAGITRRESAGDMAFWSAVESGDYTNVCRELSLTSREDADRLVGLLPALAAWRRRSVAETSSRDWHYEVTWRPLPDVSTPARPNGTWWLLMTPTLEGSPVAAAVRAALSDAGVSPVDIVVPRTADRGDMAAALSQVAGTRTGNIVSLLGLDESLVDDAPGVTQGLRLTMSLGQALADFEQSPPLWLVTTGAVSVGDDDPLARPWQALVWGMGRVVGLELPQRWGGLIDLPVELTGRARARITEALTSGAEDELAIREGGLLARRLMRVTPTDRDEHYESPDTVLITGGTGYLGRDLAVWLAQRGARHLVITSRRGPMAPGAAELADDLHMLGVEVTILACDVSDRGAVTKLVRRLERREVRIGAIFHAAGDVSVVTPLVDTTTKDLAKAAAGKVLGAAHLHEYFPDVKDFVLFASISGVWGSGHQSAYSAANAYLDALAEARHALGQAATSVQWGPWAGSAHDDHRHELERRGLRMMDQAGALASLDRILLSRNRTQVVADIDWQLFAPAYAAARARPLLADLPEARSALASASESAAEPADRDRSSELRRRLLAEPPGRRRWDALAAQCRREVGGVLALDPAQVETTAPLTSMGFDSLLSLELKRRLERTIGTNLPNTLAWRYPTVEALVPYLAECLGVTLDAPAVVPEMGGSPEVVPDAPNALSVGAPPPETDEPLAIDNLTDVEAEALLLERLESLEAGTL